MKQEARPSMVAAQALALLAPATELSSVDRPNCIRFGSEYCEQGNRRGKTRTLFALYTLSAKAPRAKCLVGGLLDNHSTPIFRTLRY
jgi:hypothetical protein